MGRQRCIGCERPVSVCLCSQLPSPPLQTRTCVVVLQHPHEARHKLSTLPVLAKCLANCHVLHGRRFQAGCSPLLDFFFLHNPPGYHVLLLFPTLSAQPISAWFTHHGLQDFCPCGASSQVDSSYPATLKGGKPTSEDFNTSRSSCQIVEMGASDSNTEDSEALSSQLGTSSHVAHDSGSLLQREASLIQLHSRSDLLINSEGDTSTCVTCDAFSHYQQAAEDGNYAGDGNYVAQAGGTSICSVNNANTFVDKSGFPDLVLIAVDATWQHANEMIRASAPYLNKFAIPVCLPFDADQEGFGMANSDLFIRKEPFKGCMTTLEAISSCLKVLEPNGLEIHDKLTCVLRSMVHFQASNIASHKVRMHQHKKNINRVFSPPPPHENFHCSEACRNLK